MLWRILRAGEGRALGRLYRLVDRVDAARQSTLGLADDELTATAARFRDRLAAGEDLDSMVVELFARVRESGRRHLGHEHRREQLACGLGLYQGLIVEFPAGEGKTLAATLAGAAWALACSGRQEMHFLTPDQVEMVADEITDPPIRTGGGEHRRQSFPEYGFLDRFAAWTGLRAGELGALRRGRVDFLRGHVHVAESVTEVHGKLVYGPTKTFETRTVPLVPSLREQLAQFMGRQGQMEDFVFHAPDGGPMRHQNFYGSHFKPAVIRTGLPGVRFHDLRHTYGALLIAQGAHPRAIMERMGHSSITVTLNTYGHLLPKIDEALTQRLEEMYRAARAAPRVADAGVTGQILDFPTLRRD